MSFYDGKQASDFPLTLSHSFNSISLTKASCISRYATFLLFLFFERRQFIMHLLLDCLRFLLTRKMCILVFFPLDSGHKFKCADWGIFVCVLLHVTFNDKMKMKNLISKVAAQTPEKKWQKGVFGVDGLWARQTNKIARRKKLNKIVIWIVFVSLWP